MYKIIKKYQKNYNNIIKQINNKMKNVRINNYNNLNSN